MQEKLERLWDEYFCEECAAMDTDDEKALTKKAFFKGCGFAVSFLGGFGKQMPYGKKQAVSKKSGDLCSFCYVLFTKMIILRS